jgi:hypothetical protein
MIDWLLTPLSGATHHSLAAWAVWHARCMVLGWGVLLPLGALAARYFKVTPGQRWPGQLDNKAWWHAHRWLQSIGIVAVTLGALLAWGQGSRSSTHAHLHAWTGWALVVLGWLQIAVGLGRGSKGGPSDVRMRGDHYDMTSRRIAFERLHKGLGWLAVMAAVAVTGLGLLVADAPRWMALALTAWWSLLALLAVRWQRQGRCIDTYQAIWGPDPGHPGNSLEPVGWGVRRPHSPTR